LKPPRQRKSAGRALAVSGAHRGNPAVSGIYHEFVPAASAPRARQRCLSPSPTQQGCGSRIGNPITASTKVKTSTLFCYRRILVTEGVKRKRLELAI